MTGRRIEGATVVFDGDVSDLEDASKKAKKSVESVGDAAKKTDKDLGNVGDAAKKTGSAFITSSGEVGFLTKEMSVSRETAAKLAGGIGAVGAALGGLASVTAGGVNPALGQFVSVAGQLTAAFAAGGVLAAGLVAVGALVSGLTYVLRELELQATATTRGIEQGFASVLDASRKRTKSLADQLKAATAILRTYGKTSAQVALIEARTAAARAEHAIGANALNRANVALTLSTLAAEQASLKLFIAENINNGFLGGRFVEGIQEATLRISQLNGELTDQEALFKGFSDQTDEYAKQASTANDLVSVLEKIAKLTKDTARNTKSITKDLQKASDTDLFFAALAGTPGSGPNANVTAGTVTSTGSVLQETEIALTGFTENVNDAAGGLRSLFDVGPKTSAFLVNFGKGLAKGTVDLTGGVAAAAESIGGAAGVIKGATAAVQLTLKAFAKSIEIISESVKKTAQNILKLGTGGSSTGASIFSTAGAVGGAAGGLALASTPNLIFGLAAGLVAPVALLVTAFTGLATQTESFARLSKQADVAFKELLTSLDPLVQQASALVVPTIGIAQAFIEVTAAVTEGTGVLFLLFVGLQTLAVATLVTASAFTQAGALFKDIVGDGDAARGLRERAAALNESADKIGTLDFEAAGGEFDLSEPIDDLGNDLSDLSSSVSDNTEATRNLSASIASLPAIFNLDRARTAPGFAGRNVTINTGQSTRSVRRGLQFLGTLQTGAAGVYSSSSIFDSDGDA